MSTPRHTIKQAVIDTLVAAIDAGERANTSAIPLPIDHITTYKRLSYEGRVMFTWLAENAYETAVARDTSLAPSGVHGNTRIIILKGREKAIADLDARMAKAVHVEDYYVAAWYRDRIRSMREASPTASSSTSQQPHEHSQT